MLDADVDTKIHMIKIADVENGSLVEFEKHRDDSSLGKSLSSFVLYWNKGSDGKVQWWAEDAKAVDAKRWAIRPGSSTSNNRPLEAAIQAAGFEGMRAKAVRCLADACSARKRGISRLELDRQLDTSASTTRSIIRELQASGSISTSGIGKSTVYSLSDDLDRLLFAKEKRNGG